MRCCCWRPRFLLVLLFLLLLMGLFRVLLAYLVFRQLCRGLLLLLLLLRGRRRWWRRGRRRLWCRSSRSLVDDRLLALRVLVATCIAALLPRLALTLSRGSSCACWCGSGRLHSARTRARAITQTTHKTGGFSKHQTTLDEDQRTHGLICLTTTRLLLVWSCLHCTSSKDNILPPPSRFKHTNFKTLWFVSFCFINSTQLPSSALFQSAFSVLKQTLHNRCSVCCSRQHHQHHCPHTRFEKRTKQNGGEKKATQLYTYDVTTGQ